ncbi:hypothetical protein [Herbidospora mongoliensis]|uniref:hypothetical protein n=1 Tax=Herbidospora mongoliensis TaxID=688067 RepID=UPI000B01C083|nr:hypothetical protein [Herbidospora mongoliensis]
MRHRRSLPDLLHRATHHIPGIPPHAERPTGHHGHGWRHSHTHHRPPRVLVAWQTRIARLFGQDPV